MESAKIALEYKSLKISYEGPSSFVGSEFVALCEQLVSLEVPAFDQVKEVSASIGKAESGNETKLSTTDIAVKLSVKSGSDMVMAAAAHLLFFAGRGDFKRSEILSEMKAAKSFYKQTYSNNLTKYLDGLVKSARLSNPSADTYAIPHAEGEALRVSLGI